MSLTDQLNADLKDAMKAGEDARKTGIRMLLAALKQARFDKRAVIAKQKSAGGELTAEQMTELENIALDEAEAISIIQKEAKARREALVDAQKANRAEAIAENETALKIIEAYLPKQLTREELVALARAAIAEAGVSDLKQIGVVMKIITPRTKGLADGKLVNEVVREVLGGG